MGPGPTTISMTVAVNTGAARSATISIAGVSISAAQQAAGPTVSISAVQNAASYGTGQVASGEIVVLYGSGMGPSQLTQFQVNSSGFIPTQLAGTSIFFNGTPAPVIYTSATQISAIVPYAITGTTVSVVVQYQGQSSSALSVPVATTLPGLLHRREPRVLDKPPPLIRTDRTTVLLIRQSSAASFHFMRPVKARLRLPEWMASRRQRRCRNRCNRCS